MFFSVFPGFFSYKSAEILKRKCGFLTLQFEWQKSSAGMSKTKENNSHIYVLSEQLVL